MRTVSIISLAVLALASAAVPHPNENVEASRMVMQYLLTRQLPNKQPSVQPELASKDSRIVIENFFTTRVDHFNPQNTAEWALRYLAVTDHYMPGGPILIRLGGMAPIYPHMVAESSLIYEMGRQMNGAVFGFESRFYGQSWVTEDASTENLHLLNTDQILADLAEFVTYIRRDVLRNEYARVMVAGEGFGGALATWFRVRYPHLAEAAWSSSGYHDARMNFQEFPEAWGETLITHGSQECYNEVFVAFHVLQNLIELELQDIISDRFNICTPIDPNNDLQVQYFLSSMMAALQGYTMVFQDVSSFPHVCEDLFEAEADLAIDSLAHWFNTKLLGGVGCMNIEPMYTVEDLKETDWSSIFVQFGTRQIFYQECIEFGWFVTTDSHNQPFGNRISTEMYSELCRLVFGDWITPESIYSATQRANNRFGGLTPNVNQIHFTNGAEDPFRMISITRDLNPSALADVIPNELSGRDMWAISPDYDSEELQAVKRRVMERMEYYLYPVDPRTTPVGKQ